MSNETNSNEILHILHKSSIMTVIHIVSIKPTYRDYRLVFRKAMRGCKGSALLTSIVEIKKQKYGGNIQNTMALPFKQFHKIGHMNL